MKKFCLLFVLLLVWLQKNQDTTVFDGEENPVNQRVPVF